MDTQQKQSRKYAEIKQATQNLPTTKKGGDNKIVYNNLCPTAL